MRSGGGEESHEASRGRYPGRVGVSQMHEGRGRPSEKDAGVGKPEAAQAVCWGHAGRSVEPEARWRGGCGKT